MKFLNKYNFLFFAPLLIYIGERSPIATDEGYYILQAKWILDSGDWISPMAFGELALDRTIAIQALIAFSQKIFGENFFAIYLPNILAGSLMLFFTSQIHKELLGRKSSIFSAFILSTSFLWINYFHMSSQDIIYGTCVTLGIFSAIKASKKRQILDYILSGIWIGLAVMFKTYLALIPLIALIPFLKITKIINSKYFWIGVFLGFIPFFMWSSEIISIYGYETFSGLYSKLISLSKNNTFTNPFYYYLWNLILNTLPWSLFSIIGLCISFKSKNNLQSYFLFKYPLIVISLLSIFSTKTPYYPIQILSIVSINSFLGILYVLNKKNYYSKIFKKLIFLIFSILIFTTTIYLNINNYFQDINLISKFLINFSLLIFSATWLYLPFAKKNNRNLFLIIIGPYLIFSLTVQSGVFCDRAKEIRIASQYILEKENLFKEKIEFILTGQKDESVSSKLIKIAIFMPKIGTGKEYIEDLKKNEYAWTAYDKEKILMKDNVEIIAEAKALNPWKLIQKK